MSTQPSRESHVTVGGLRRWLEGFDQDATVVVPVGVGYEEPRIVTAEVRPVTVPQRYVWERHGEVVVCLRPVNG